MPAPPGGVPDGPAPAAGGLAWRSWSRPGVAVPAVLGLVLVLLVLAGALLGHRADSVARASIGDTGPVLAGATLPPDGSAGPPAVALSPAAAAHPRSRDVRELVQRSVDARNTGGYDAWRATLVDDARTDGAAFAAETRSVRIGSVVLRRIDPVGGGELVVPMGFVTTQDPADAPADVRVPRLCWQVSGVVRREEDGLRLVVPRPGSQLRTPC